MDLLQVTLPQVEGGPFYLPFPTITKRDFSPVTPKGRSLASRLALAALVRICGPVG